MKKDTARESDSKMSDAPEIEMDPADLRVNFSDEEAGSEAMDFTPMPTGKYLVAITEVEIRYSTSEKNNGKPYWHITHVVQGGPYADRKLWGNVMLFEGALYSLAQLMKAIGRGDVLESGNIPSGDELLGQQVIVSVVKQLDKYRMDQAKMAGEESPEPVYKNEIKGYKPSDSSVSAASGGNSLLP